MMASPAPRSVAAALVAVLAGLALASTVAVQASQQKLVLARQEHHESLLQARANPLAAFTEWATRHAKEYLNDAAASKHRFSVWLDNLEYAIAYNSAKKTHWLGMNHLADLTLEEYRARYTSGFDNAARLARLAANGAKKPTGFMYANVSDDDLPLHIDWRQLGAVSEVKNQAQCGSCWAFSTTGSVEGINAIFSKQLLSLSEQELVDCDTKEDKGCRGGLMDYAYEWIIENKGITTEQDYPYTAEDGECVARKKHHRYVTIDGYEDIPPNDEAALKKAVAHQPVSVAIEADQKSFQLYVGGVFDDAECGTALDHGVLVVGYGHDATGGWYWDVKNSWGDQWGEAGYIRIAMGAAVKEGLCGIAMAASYPTKTSPNPPPPGPDPPEPEPGPGPAPGPAPGPVDCDDDSQCPAGTTCCCVSEAFNMCFQWGCCPMENAVCCSDHQHCCPSTLPVCDTRGGRCLPGSGSELGAVPWSAKLPATTRKAGGAAARSRVAASRKAAVAIAAQKK